jgi:hypothetical protein
MCIRYFKLMTTATYNMIVESGPYHKSGTIMKLCAFPHSTRNFLFRKFTVHVRNVFGFFFAMPVGTLVLSVFFKSN